jgi:hypothetical protein
MAAGGLIILLSLSALFWLHSQAGRLLASVLGLASYYVIFRKPEEGVVYAGPAWFRPVAITFVLAVMAAVLVLGWRFWPILQETGR